MTARKVRYSTYSSHSASAEDDERRYEDSVVRGRRDVTMRVRDIHVIKVTYASV